MQQFVVPQFIDNEDKILGPITVRQFIIVLVTALVVFVFYKTLRFAPFLLVSFFVGGFGIVLAFVKVNGRPFHYFILNVIQITIRPALRVWKKEIMSTVDKKDDIVDKKPPSKVVRPKQVSASRLSELSLLVDTGGEYRPEQKV